MFVLMCSRSSSKLGHLVSKTRSPGEISRKLCYNHFELWSECLTWSVLDQALKVLCCSDERYRAIMALLYNYKLVENTTKYIHSKLDTDKLGQDWTCPQQIVKSLAPLRYYKSKPQYFPIQTISLLDSDASQIDISRRGKYSVSIKNTEIWERRACSLVAINSHADLFSSAAYQCLHQEAMSVNALSRLMEAVAKSIRHATAMSIILATELFQARLDAAIASSKILYWIIPVMHCLNSQLLFDNKILRKWHNLILKHNNIDSWHLLPITHLCNLRNHHIWLQVLSGNLDSPLNLLGLNRMNHIGLRISHSPLYLILERTFLRRAVTYDRSPSLNLPHLPQSFESQPFPLPTLPCPGIPMQGPLCGN